MDQRGDAIPPAKGQKPNLVKLNVILNGTGTVWVDDIALVKGRLR